MPEEEADVLARAVDGDASAFEVLVQQYAPRVWRLAVRMVGAADAPDATQEAFVAAWQALGRFRPRQPFAPWLMTIATNRCLNRLRSRKRSRLSTIEDVHFKLRDEAPMPDEQWEREEQKAALEVALHELPETPMAIVTLHYMEGIPCAEIARLLGMQESAVKVALFRARQKLREILRRT
ncbi:MAG: RNA polymerase sigma factor [Candidatus Xenobia bacterium]